MARAVTKGAPSSSSRLLFQAALLLVCACTAITVCDAAVAGIFPTYTGFQFHLNADGTPQDYGTTVCAAPCLGAFLFFDGQPHGVTFPADQAAKITPVVATVGYQGNIYNGQSGDRFVALSFTIPGTYTFVDTVSPSKVFGSLLVIPDGVPAPSGVTNPNQCYNNVGDEYVFCPGNCARSAGLASCAGIPPGRTVDPVIQAPGSVTFPMWAINSFHNPVNCKAPCTVTWVWGDANPHAIAGFGPNADAQVRTDNNKRPGIKPNLVVQQNFTVSLTFAKPDLYGFDDALYSAAAFGSVNVYDGSSVPCLNSAINPNPTYSADGSSLTCV